MSVISTTAETFGPDLINAYTEAVAAYEGSVPSLDTTVTDFRASISPIPEDYASIPPEKLAELGLTALTVLATSEARSRRISNVSNRIQNLLAPVIGSRVHVAYTGDPEIESPITEEIIRINGYGFEPYRHPLEATGTVTWTSRNGYEKGVLYLDRGRFRPRRYAVDLVDPTRPVSLSVLPGRSNLR